MANLTQKAFRKSPSMGCSCSTAAETPPDATQDAAPINAASPRAASDEERKQSIDSSDKAAAATATAAADSTATAATKVQAIHRGRADRKQQQAASAAATTVQAIQRGRA
eukprot:4194473-Prymnesium_polylepis.1